MLLHFLNTARIKRPVKHLYDMETVEDHLSIREKLFGHNIVIVIEVYGYSLNLASYSYRETLEVVDDVFLEYFDDLMRVAINGNKVQLSADTSEFIKGQVFRQPIGIFKGLRAVLL